MVRITLPDGSVRSYENEVTALQVAEEISSGLAKATITAEVNGVLTDITTPITTDSTLRLLTLKDEMGMDTMRHTVAAQCLAKAVKRLYPSAKLAIGPTVEHGFYYDVLFENAISSEDLEEIEKEMRKVVEEGLNIQRTLYTKQEAIALFEKLDEPYKVQILKDAPDQESFQIYQQGEGDNVFYDLCRGPHLNTMKKIGAFKLQKVAGAYWRGDSNNEMLTRIYGTAWATEKDLKKHLHMLEEAEKRDHRKLGKQMDLFHLQAEAPGQVFWHDKGWTIFVELQNYIREKLRKHDYKEVNTPQIISKDLYVKSGHWEKFGTENMFITEAYDNQHALKPMNCPCHVQIFNQGTKSYRDLPLRMSEFGTCMRHESHGALHGIMRVTSMTQDDAHIFCTTDQVEQEVVMLCELIKEIYEELGFGSPSVKFSDRPETRVGSDEVWDQAEGALKNACDRAGLEWTLNPGEGAFYGPKLEFVLVDAIGRDWQCGTIQMDFNLPGRLDAEYDSEDGGRKTPVMIHRALLGSLERFTGVLIEHYVGSFPLWLAPEQLVISAVTEKQNPEVEKFVQRFKDAGIRVKGDYRNEKINYKIREHSHNKVACIGIVGDREITEDTITIRRLGSQAQKTYKVDEFIGMMLEEIKTRALPPSFIKNENAA